MKYLLSAYLTKARAVREERKKKYDETWKQMSIESLVDFSKAKLERYKFSHNQDDIVDILNYLEFILRRTT